MRILLDQNLAPKIMRKLSTVDTVYDSWACSPLGTVKQVSQPYAPGGTVYWTVYSYDGLGRTTSIALVVTSTDAAGKTKTLTSMPCLRLARQHRRP